MASGSLNLEICTIKWVKVFKNGTSKICGRQHLKNFTSSFIGYLHLNVTIAKGF